MIMIGARTVAITRELFSVACLATLVLLDAAPSSTAKADTIVNIDSLVDPSQNPSGNPQTFGPGTYNVTLAGIAGGGIYDAWDPFNHGGVSGCDANGANCTNGWTENFIIKSPALSACVL